MIIFMDNLASMRVLCCSAYYKACPIMLSDSSYALNDPCYAYYVFYTHKLIMKYSCTVRCPYILSVCIY